MKLTQRQIKRIIKEELENILEEQTPLEEGIIDNIKKFFSAEDPFEGNYGSFQEDEQYNEGTYGQFLQATGILSTLKKNNIDLKKNAISTAGQALLGSGESSAGAVIGLTAAMVGLIPAIPALAATALGYAGAPAATIGFVKLFRKNPSLAEKYPLLTAFQMDEKLIEIIDDKLEIEILEAYTKKFIEAAKQNPADQMMNINIYARDWLRDNKNGRTIAAPGLPAA